jgi:signal transduction histidine kinase
VFTTGADGRIDAWSDDAETLFGWPAANVLGASPSRLFSDAVATALATPGELAVQTEACVRRFARADGSLFQANYSILRLSGTGSSRHAHVVTPSAPGSSSDDLRVSEEARLLLLRRLIIAQEGERRRIARDLHDHLGQQLTSLRLKLESVRDATVASPSAQSALQQAGQLLVQIDRDVDFLSWELRPAALDDLGLKPVLESYVREWSHHSGVTARFHAQGIGDETVAPEIETTLYRIAQEALNNVTKHAQARSVAVLLEKREHTIALVVEDDGVGFEPSGSSSTMIGVLGMRERAEIVGGSVDIEPTANGGTTVLARLPLHLTNSLPPGGTDLGRAPGAAAEPRVDRPPATPSASTSRLRDLEHAVASRDEFIATVAHELRNPLSPLMFQVRLSIDKVDQMDRAGESVSHEWARTQLRRIEQRLHRLLEILDRLLDVSRLASGRIDLELEHVDLVESLTDVLASFEAELAVARCEVRLKTPPTVTGWWDRLRLDQICRNLVSNALRFGAGRPIDITVGADDTTATLVVRDHGVGIPPEQQDLIFERFARAPEASRSGGFGIGLWVVRNICLSFGGSIRVDSAVGDGASFAVSLPRRSSRDSSVRRDSE